MDFQHLFRGIYCWWSFLCVGHQHVIRGSPDRWRLHLPFARPFYLLLICKQNGKVRSLYISCFYSSRDTVLDLTNYSRHNSLRQRGMSTLRKASLIVIGPQKNHSGYIGSYGQLEAFVEAQWPCQTSSLITGLSGEVVCFPQAHAQQGSCILCGRC